MGLLRFTTATSSARTSSTQADLGTATGLFVMARVSGSWLRNASAAASGTLAIRNAAGTARRITLEVAHAGGTVYVLQAIGNADPDVAATVTDSSISAGLFYRVYMHIGAGGRLVELYSDDGSTLLATASGAGGAVPNNAAANSLVLLGDYLTTSTGTTGDIDAIAIGAGTRAGVDRYANAQATDGDILWLHTFDVVGAGPYTNSVSGATALDTLSGVSVVSGGVWDTEAPAPELAAGTATLGTVNGYLVQATCAAATGGTEPYTYQWQRSARSAGSWSDVTGATSLSMRDATVAPGTNYDYRCVVTDADSTTDASNTIQPNVPAAAPVWGIMGASNTDEYRADDDRAGGTVWEDTTLGWVELLIHHRGLNCGAWSDVSRGEPRRRGYEYNWARDGADLVDIEVDQVPGVVGQLQSGTVTHVAMELSINDWDDGADGGNFFDQMYNSPDAGIHTQDGRLVATIVNDYVARVEDVLDDLVEAGAAGVIIFGLPWYMAYPTAPLMGYPDAVRCGYHNAVMDAVNTAVQDYCTALNTQYGYTVAKMAWWDEYLHTEVWDTLSGTEVTIAGVQVEAGVSPDGNPQYLFVDDHASPLIGGLVCNAFIDAVNELDGIALSTFSDSEILSNAGIEAAPDITGDGAVTLPALTAAGTGVVLTAGAGAATLPALTASGAATVAVAASGSAALPALTASGAGTVQITGTGAVTLPALTASGSTSQTTTGEGAVTLPALTASGTGVVEVQAAGVVMLPALTAGGTATTLVTGSGSVLLPALTVAATGVVTIVGHGAVTLPMLVVMGAETVPQSLEIHDVTLTLTLRLDHSLTVTQALEHELTI